VEEEAHQINTSRINRPGKDRDKDKRPHEDINPVPKTKVGGADKNNFEQVREQVNKRQA
jgi:hypothetical protein